MDASDLKEHIIEKDLIISVLEKLGMHKIKKHSTEIRCALPNKTNGTSVSIKLETLSTTVFSEGDRVSGDIITLVSHIKNLKFIQSLKWLHEACDLQFKGITRKQEDNKIDPLALFKSIKCNDKGCHISKEVKLYDEDILNSYIIMPHIELFKEGISVQTQRKFNIGYNSKDRRIIFPHYFHSGDNKIAGIFGRTTNKDYKLLEIPKYIGLLKYPKSTNLYGYSHNYQDIQESGMVVVVEGEKSVLKIDTFGYKNAVAIGSHAISDEQKRLLLGLDVEIVIGFDNDIKENELIDICKQFNEFRVVSYIKDKDNILDKKDSPCDKGIKVYDKLLNNRIQVK